MASAEQFPSEPATSGQAIASLVLGVLAFCLPLILSIPAIIFGLVSLGTINSSRGAIKGRGLAITGIVLGAVSLLMLIPLAIFGLMMGVQKMREKAITLETSNNFKQLGLAMHTYHDHKHRLPGRSSKLSWRVELLPYIQETALYKSFRHDEPWDSPHNLTLLEAMPRIYQCGRRPAAAPGMTYVQGFSRPGTVLGSTQGVAFVDIGAANTGRTIVAIEAPTAVPWTKPDDINDDPAQVLSQLAKVGNSDFTALFADGHVEFLPVKQDAKAFAAMTRLPDK